MAKTASTMQNYHSVTFKYTDANKIERTFNTWTNWNLIPVSRPMIAQPNPIYTYVDIPGADGSLDLTDYLVGRPTYSDRSGSFQFYVINNDGGKNWPKRKAELASVLDGKIMKISLDDDRDHYYKGRCYFRQWSPGADFSQVTIEYRVGPYRYNKNGKEVGL